MLGFRDYKGSQWTKEKPIVIKIYLINIFNLLNIYANAPMGSHGGNSLLKSPFNISISA